MTPRRYLFAGEQLTAAEITARHPAYHVGLVRQAMASTTPPSTLPELSSFANRKCAAGRARILQGARKGRRAGEHMLPPIARKAAR